MKNLIIFLILLTTTMLGQTWTGTGTKVDPYLIDTPQEFQDMENTVYVGVDAGKYFKLTADLDFTGFGTFSSIDGDGTQVWGNYLDGNHKTISNIDLTCGLSIASGNQVQGGIFRGIRFSVTTGDTATPVLQRITFDGVNLKGTGTHEGSIGITNIQYGIIAGTGVVRRSTYGGNADSNVITTPLLDSVIVKNVDYSALTDQTYIRGFKGDDYIAGGVIGYLGGYAKRVGFEGEFRIAMEDISKDVTLAHTGAGAGHLFGITLWHTKIEQCYVNGITRIYETDNVNRVITVGKIIGIPRDYQTWIIDTYAQDSIVVTQPGGTAMTTRVGGLVGSHYAQGVGEYISYRGVYFAGGVSTTSLDDPGLLWGNTAYGHEIDNAFVDTLVNTGGLIDIYNTVTNAPAILGVSGQTEAQTKKTTTQMQTQSTFTASLGYPYDFTNTWQIVGANYPTLQAFNGTPGAITILTPTNGSNQYFPITVTWNGVGAFANWDSVFIYTQGTLVDSVFLDSTYTILTGTTELSFPIAVKNYANQSLFDSIAVRSFQDGELVIDSAWTNVAQDSVFYDVIGSNLGDQAEFYIGNSTTTSEMTLAGTASFGSGIITGIYGFVRPAAFYSTGSTTWFKVETTEDSTDNLLTGQAINFVGQIGGTRLCWTSSQDYPVEVRGIRDLSCGWVSGIERTYTTASLIIPQTGDPYWDFDENACASPYVGCTWAQKTFQAQDTTGGGTTITTEKYAETAAYLNTGVTITVNNRRYYISGQTLLVDDLTNAINGTQLYDLSAYFDNGQMFAPELWYFPYQTNITTVVQHDGTIDTELPARDTTLIVIYEKSGFQRLWSFNASAAPTQWFPVYSATYSVTASFNSNLRGNFRGIDPKFIRVRP